MYCKILPPGKKVIGYKSNVTELFFILHGAVEVYNNETDEVEKEKPILYLPQHSYFGDYQALYNLRSNIVFNTLSSESRAMDQRMKQYQDMDIIFMCIGKE